MSTKDLAGRMPCQAPARAGARTGDMLVAHGGGTPRLGRTGAPWRCVFHEGEWRVWSQSETSEWSGFPVREHQAARGRAWLLGELFPAGDNSVEDVLDEVIRDPDRATALNGNFLLFAWLPHARQWAVWTNRMGSLHAYYSTGRRPSIGTCYRSVAGAGSDGGMCWSGLAGYLACGFFPGDRTFLKDIRIFRPASHYVFDARGRLVHSRRYWDWRYEPDTRRSPDDTIAELDARLREVMKDHAGSGRIALPVSGGLDSRTLAAAAGDGAGRVWSYSYGYSPDSIESRIARQVAEARKMPFSPFTIRPYLAKSLDRVMAATEGFQDVTQTRQAAVIDEIALKADYVLGGHAGDLWFDTMGLAGNGDPGVENVLRHALKKFRKRGSDWLIGNIAARQIPGAAECVAEQVRQELDRLSSIGDPDFRIKALKVDQWVFRWTNASLRMYQARAFPRLPFYDNRIVDFFLTVPAQLLGARALQVEYLKRRATDLARIDWQKWDADLFHYRHFNTWLLPRRIARKAWRIVTRKKIAERNWEVQFLSREGRRFLESGLLRGGARLHQLVPPARIGELIGDFYRQPLGCGRGYTVSMLLTLSAALETLP